MANQHALTHYGIPGMHWGRKMTGHSGIKTKTRSIVKPSADHTEKNTLRTKKIHEMSNDDIRKLTTRLNLEKQVKDLTPNTYKKGMNVVKGITSTGTTVASLYALSTTPLGVKIISAIKKQLIK